MYFKRKRRSGDVALMGTHCNYSAVIHVRLEQISTMCTTGQFVCLNHLFIDGLFRSPSKYTTASDLLGPCRLSITANF